MRKRVGNVARPSLAGTVRELVRLRRYEDGGDTLHVQVLQQLRIVLFNAATQIDDDDDPT